MDIILLVSVLALLIIVAIKALNVSYGVGNKQRVYGMPGALATGAIAVVIWFFALSIYTASITEQSVSTITGGSSTLTIVEQGNQYVGSTPFMAMAGMLLLVCFFLTMVELLIGTGNTAIEMAGGPRAEKYQH